MPLLYDLVVIKIEEFLFIFLLINLGRKQPNRVGEHLSEEQDLSFDSAICCTSLYKCVNSLEL